VIQIDDFKFIGVLFVPFGLVEAAWGFASSDAIGAKGDLLPLIAIAGGALTVTAGIAAYRRLSWAKYLVALAAFLMAPAFPFGTVLAAVAFIALGRDWRRNQSARAHS
jgi:hypothetical protein